MAYLDPVTNKTHAVTNGNLGTSVRKALGMDDGTKNVPQSDPSNPLAKYGIEIGEPIEDKVCFGCDKHQ